MYWRSYKIFGLFLPSAIFVESPTKHLKVKAGMGECSVRQRWWDGTAPSKVTLIFPVKLGQLHNCCTAFEGSPLLPDLRKFLQFRKSGQGGIGEELCASFQERNFPWGNKARLRKVQAIWRVRRGLICGNLGQILPSFIHYCIPSRHFVQDGLFVLIFCETFFRPRSNLCHVKVTHCSFAKPKQA